MTSNGSSANQRPDLPEGLNLPSAGGASTALAGGRRAGAASVTLRQRDEEVSTGLDPATKSLADALRITYRLLQAAMVVLLGLYLLSGFQSVKESERGIRLTLGRVSARDLPPGFQFSLPAPFGELVKVNTGLQTREIDKQFFARLTEGEEKTLVDKEKGVSALAGGTDSLDPDSDGHLITADGNIAHARWSVTYQREEASQTASSIDPEHEAQIVTAAANRGIVRAAASLTIDDLLRKQVDTAASQAGTSKVETIAREAAQKALDDMESGIQISQLTMTLVIPPRNVMNAFQDVQAAQSRKARSIEDANTARNDTLIKAAGEASGVLLTLIDRYERALGTGDAAGADAAMGLIEKVMLKEEVEIDGQKSPRVSGAVSRIVDDARQFRTGVVNRAQSDVATFEAKRLAFQKNPSVMLNGEFTDALGAFMRQESVQTIMIPPDIARHRILINRDPLVTREITRAKLLEENKKAEEERLRARDRARFEERMNPTNSMTSE